MFVCVDVLVGKYKGYREINCADRTVFATGCAMCLFHEATRN